MNALTVVAYVLGLAFGVAAFVFLVVRRGTVRAVKFRLGFVAFWVCWGCLGLITFHGHPLTYKSAGLNLIVLVGGVATQLMTARKSNHE